MIDRRPVRVLLVDDDEDAYLLTRRHLARSQAAQFELEWVASYEAALLRMCRKQHDAYLVDYRLGARDGLALLREAQAHGCTGPIILLTGQGESSVDLEAMRAGAADYLNKDELTPHLLERAIRYALERHRAEVARREFMHLVVHDLKTPITTIRGYAQLLQRWASRPDPPNPAEMVSRLAQIDTTAGEMLRLINRLLDVAHLGAGQPLALERRPVDLVVLAQQIATAQQRQTTWHQFAVQTTVSALVGDWDQFRLERAIENLVANAVKYSPQGGPITLDVERENDAAGAWALLRVRDRGIGIATDDLPHVFDQFYRARAVVGQLPGTGIGLASARQIVEQHGGTITVDSQEGDGTTFTVRLPLSEPGGESSPN